MDLCFQCEKEIKPEEINKRFPDRCPHCSWGGGPGLPEDDPRYLVFVSLIQRAKEAGDEYFRRLEPTQREFAMLEHGDQCKFDGALWRITAKNVEKTVFYVSGWRVGFSKGGRLVTAGIDRDLDEEIKKQEAWEEQSKAHQKEADERRQEALDRGYFEPEDIDYMEPEDWEGLSDEERDDLLERYNDIME